MTVEGVVGYMESASPYQTFKKKDPKAATSLLQETEKRWENKQDVEDTVLYTVHAEGGCADPFKAASVQRCAPSFPPEMDTCQGLNSKSLNFKPV